MSNSSFKAFVEEHPKLLGVLFGLALMSTQVGGALGAASATFCGP